MQLILASTSPRRRELLALLQIPFQVVSPAFEEQVHAGVPPIDQARRFAEGKALGCQDLFRDALIIGGDTLIALESEVLGKPENLAQASAMLGRLRGRDHLIHTGVALVHPAERWQITQVETVRVWVKALSDAELDQYIRTGESLGKAGGYAIQGAGGQLIERIEGDYTAAVGLPLRLLTAMLRTRGIPVPIDVDHLYHTRPYPNWKHFLPEPSL